MNQKIYLVALWIDMSEDKTIIASFEQISALKSPKRNRPSCLVQYNGEHLGKRFSVDKNINIAGRSPQAAIFIDEPSVSRRHAKIFSGMDETVTIEDLGSSNGTYVNDNKIKEKTVINNGDMVRFGAILLKFFSSSDIDNIVHDKIYQMVTIDPGTGVFNKRYLQDTIKSEFKLAKSYHQDLSVIYYDLDFFKKVNDNLGHEAGDQVLKVSAQIVKSQLRKQDKLCRFGGEEFIIILPATTEQIATKLAERIRISVQNYVFAIEQKAQDGSKKNIKHKQTISLGVAGVTSQMSSPAALLELADSRLYKSKHTGRNRVTAG